jgi:hypothetical protein
MKWGCLLVMGSLDRGWILRTNGFSAGVPNRGGHGAGWPQQSLDSKGSHEESVRSDGPGPVRDLRALSPVVYPVCDCGHYICLLPAWIDPVICLGLRFVFCFAEKER